MRLVECLALLFCLLLSSTSSGAEEARPNILIAISDDQTWAHTSAAGYDQVQTPAFDRVARLGGLFRQAFGASPGCSPCRAALLTGRHTWQIEEAGTHASSFPRKYRVFPELLAEAGYHAGYTGKGWGPGNFKVSGWDQNPAGKSYAKRKAADHPPGTSNNDYAANFADFLAERQKNQPFVFWYGATEPHRGYADGIGKKSGKDLTKIKVPGFLPEAETIRSDIADYLVEIEWFDQHLGRMLD
ncbi:MAG: sulfatase-like hydrolase/transferase, partial [Planctomycetaceae bacterium]|nr:sulfatase-like hydrolase/transferase [Planctomycetaceae bacterium]